MTIVAYAQYTLLAILILGSGAAWRRWFGSARPAWAFPGYRGGQVAAGIGFLALLGCAAVNQFTVIALISAAAAIGFMTLPAIISKVLFDLLATALGLTPGRVADQPIVWGEVLQGAILFAAAVLAVVILA